MSVDVITVLVVGSGLAGLGAAISIHDERYKVTVVESTKALTEVGAGLQITAQTVKSFRRWGLAEKLEPLAALPKKFVMHRYSDGAVLAEEPDWKGWQEERFGDGVWDLHRADMQLALFEKAKEIGVEFKFGCPVENIDCENAVITLKTGETLTADLVVAADGLHSKARQSLVGRHDPPLPTGDLAYRIVLNVEDIPDERMRRMVSEPACRLYAGPKAHVIMYSLKGGNQVNIVLLVPDDLPPEVRTKAAGNTSEMMSLFDGWDPLLREFLSLVKEVDKWRLMHHKGLDTWHHPSGRTVLLGDAVHPMLPYLAQGANSAIEDGVVLGECLHKATSKEDIPKAVKIFERIRKPRSDKVVALTHKQRHWNHLEDGAEQRERDELIAEQVKNGRDANFPSAWINPELWGFLCAYDPVKEVQERWEELYGQV